MAAEEVAEAAVLATVEIEGIKHLCIGNQASYYRLNNANQLRCNNLLKGGGMNIYIGNLSLETTEDELRQEFTPFGEVTSVTIMNDKYIGSGQTHGYGFVEMESKSDAMTAIAELGGKRVRGRLISVVEALPLSQKNSPRSRVRKKGYRPGRSRQRYY
jgi:hypothetical protein